MGIEGNTPFEVAERNRQIGIAMIEIAANTQKIVEYINECEAQISYFLGLQAIGQATREERAIAREARKDKKKYEEALIVLAEIMADKVNIEA